jgi:predicted nuclease with TOPRIM domain|tara:strand:- start:679 stop:978 length:300 start_codon:yes stop_codon:yes gene_type:complete
MAISENKEIKFTDEELKSLSELSTEYQRTQFAFGQARVQRIALNKRLSELDEAEVKLEADYDKLQKQEQDLVKQLNDKYGPGSLDPETGVFTPTPVEKS